MKKITIKAKDNADINTVLYEADTEQTKGIVIVCYGFGEHVEMYNELAEHLQQHGYTCVLYDQRGHGPAPDGRKKWFGIIDSYQCFLDDADAVAEAMRAMKPGVPVVLYGHSMGGNIAVNHLLQKAMSSAAGNATGNTAAADTASVSGKPGNPAGYACAILESPWLGLSNGPSPALVGVVKFLSHILPDMIVPNKLTVSDISSDPERANGYTTDPLYHNFISTRMFTGINNGCKTALANAALMPVPVYLAYAANERIVCNKAIKQFAAAAGDMVTLKEYASCHAIHNDVKHEEYFTDMIGYLDAHCLS